MDVHSNKTMKETSKYKSSLLDSMMDLLTGYGSTYKWRGRHDSVTDYKMNDVVVYLDNGTPSLYVANEDNKGPFDIRQWSLYQISISGQFTYKATTFTLVIEKTDWVDDDTYEDFTKKKEILVTGIDASSVPLVMIYPDYQDISAEALMCPTCITEMGRIIFYANKVPTEDIWSSVTVLSTETSSSYDIIIPTVGWVEDNTHNDYSWRIDLSLDYVREMFIPLVFILPEYLTEAAECGLCTTVLSFDGRLRFFAKVIPGKPIAASLTLLGDRNYINGSSGKTEIEAGELITIEENTIDVNKAALLRSNLISNDRYINEILNELYGNDEDDRFD